MVDFASLEVQADVPETNIASVKLGAAANIYLDAYPGRTYPGRVSRIWPTASRQKASIEVRVVFEKRDQDLRPDMGVRVVFLTDETASTTAISKPQILIPEDALLKNVTRTYRRGGQGLEVLQGLDLEMEGGSFYALMGPSGSGKTTLLNLIGGLDQPDSGEVFVDGEDLAAMTNQELAQWRADKVGFVFQGFNLLPVLTALENVELPLQLTPLSKAQRREQARRALNLVGLGDRESHRPRELSGGQEQRVAIARALAMDPTVILADEPTGDLDRDSAEQVLQLLERLNQEMGKTILMVTHDPLAAEHARHIVHLDKGRLGRITENEKPGPDVVATEATKS
jgi:putative ABC transport system ATP-binding protein